MSSMVSYSLRNTTKSARLVSVLMLGTAAVMRDVGPHDLSIGKKILQDVGDTGSYKKEHNSSAIAIHDW